VQALAEAQPGTCSEKPYLARLLGHICAPRGVRVRVRVRVRGGTAAQARWSLLRSLLCPCRGAWQQADRICWDWDWDGGHMDTWTHEM
jgi:hypothetical protein